MAANTAEAVRSAVETARLVVDASASGRAPSRYVLLMLGEAEDGLTSISTSLEIVQPPSQESARLREAISSTLTAARSTAGTLRVRAQAGRLEELPALAEPPPAISSKLEAFEKLRPT